MQLCTDCLCGGGRAIIMLSNDPEHNIVTIPLSAAAHGIGQQATLDPVAIVRVDVIAIVILNHQHCHHHHHHQLLYG